MLKLAISLQHPDGFLAARRSEAMAHRRRLVKGRVGLAAIGTLAVGLLAAGSIFVAGRATDLRKSISTLEAEIECGSARFAELQTEWNMAASPAEITNRAQRELDMVPAMDPGLVLAAYREKPASALDDVRRVLEGLAGGETANAAEVAFVEPVASGSDRPYGRGEN